MPDELYLDRLADGVRSTVAPVTYRDHLDYDDWGTLGGEVES